VLLRINIQFCQDWNFLHFPSLLSVMLYIVEFCILFALVTFNL
jgi:hypothetical protein